MNSRVVIAGSLGFLGVMSGVTQEMALTHTRGQLDFFESKIRPQLIKHCYECHSTDSDKIKGGLLLDSRDATLQGGNTGAAVVPGDLGGSLLYTAISYSDDSMEMPPKHKLPDSVIGDFKQWIEMGAPDPRQENAVPNRSATYTNTIDVDAGRADHWAYQKPVKAEIPSAAGDWAKGAIDQFIFESLKENQLSPAEDAGASTLLRRLSFDLVGLPPSPDLAREFLRSFPDEPDAAIARATDQLMASDQFGERWARHWLDVARYAESTGKETNATYPSAWRYRDWVIDAFNQDLPFDEMIQHQLAGDLLEASMDSPSEKTVATGFLAIGVKGLNERNLRQFRFDVVDEQIDVTTRAFLATTAACSRCHDHKFDPIPMSDYYSLAGIFLSSDTHYGTARTQQNFHPTSLIELPSEFSPAGDSLSLGNVIDRSFQLSLLDEQLAEAQAELQRVRGDGNRDEILPALNRVQRLSDQSRVLKARLERYEDDGRIKNLAMGMSDSREPFDSQILIRGEEENTTKERAARGFLQVIRTGDERGIPEKESGRLQMAQWISSPENPLTARVYANRVWLWLFGEGLVSSVDNFGTTGESPSHPELLDYLALRLIELDWSTKDLIREMVVSRTYRMASTFRQDHFDQDPENRLLWRANKRRLDAESMRDAILAVSGQLDLERPVSSVVAQGGAGFVGRTLSAAQLNSPSVNRSVYLPIVRDQVPEVLSLFDFSDPSLMAGKREVTTVPSQALYWMNSDFVIQASQQMADFLIKDKQLKGAKLGVTAFIYAYSRYPSEAEGEATKAYFEKFIPMAIESGKSREEATRLAVVTFCQSLLSSAEFQYLN
ncbi:MAG: PSD1 and planctomycete cytochrome C domain-containing protein [Verrucomicrobiota bacterium]